MAIDLEKEIMKKIGLSSHYLFYNGSASCRVIRRNAIRRLTKTVEKYGLSISFEWLRQCKRALVVDDISDRESSLTNTWMVCSYAIQDAIEKKNGNSRIPIKNYFWEFWDDNGRKALEFWLNNNQEVAEAFSTANERELAKYFNI